MLIVALEVLALLSIMAVAFAAMMSVELKASHNEIDRGRARFVAMAGVEAAIADLQEEAKSKFYPSPSDPWVFEGNYAGGCGGLVELDSSTNISYKQTLSGRILSGALGNSYPGGMDYFRLKIWDHASRLNLNNNWSEALFVSVLENLGEGIGLYTSIPNPIGAGKAKELLAFRRTLDGDQFRSVDELAEVLGKQGAGTLSSFVTFQGWKDPSTKSPLPSAQHVSESGTLDANDYDKPDPRYPVNINSASKPVLYALLKNLEGYRSQTQEIGAAALGTKSVKLAKTTIKLTDQAKVKQLVDDIFTRRQTTPFRTWEEFSDYLDSKVGSILTRDEAELIVANGNPNVRLNKFGPPRALQAGYDQGGAFCLGVDKVDLIKYTTEFCFSSMGYFHVESRGVIESKDGVVMATAKLGVDVRVFEVIKLSTQQDFVSHGTSRMGMISYPDIVVSGNVNKQPSRSIGWLQLDSTFPSVGGGNVRFEGLFTDSMDPTSGSGTKKGSKIDSKTLLDGGDLTPEGIICWYNRDRSLTYDSISDWPMSTRGATEFWIKLLTPPEKGSNEVLFYAQDKVGTRGYTWRLERYGTELVSTRFYWGGRLNATVWNQVTADLSKWNANEWHHIAVSWGLLEAVRHNIFIDGKKASLEQSLSGFQPGATVNIGGYAVPIAPDKYNKFRLISYSPDLVGFLLGGYKFDAGTGGNRNLYQINVKIENQVTRYSNAIFDDLRIYNDPKFSGDFPPYSRYEALVGTPAYYELALPIPKGVHVSSLGWTVLYPKTYQKGPGSVTVYQKGSKRLLDVKMKYKLGTGSWQTLPGPSGSNYEGQASPINTGLTEDGVSLRIEIENTGNLDPLNVTPVIDDITLAYLSSPKTLSYKWLE